MERKRSRCLLHIRPRRGLPFLAKARHGLDLPCSPGRRGWLRVLQQAPARHPVLGTQLLRRVRQRRRDDERGRELALLIPDPQACGEEAEVGLYKTLTTVPSLATHTNSQTADSAVAKPQTFLQYNQCDAILFDPPLPNPSTHRTASHPLALSPPAQPKRARASDIFSALITFWWFGILEGGNVSNSIPRGEKDGERERLLRRTTENPWETSFSFSSFFLTANEMRERKRERDKFNCTDQFTFLC